MGKHDAMPEGNINESLERHYQKRIKDLEENIADLEHDLNQMRCEIERLHFKIKLKDVEIESLVKAMAGNEM